MSGFVSWTEFLHECSVCRRQTLEGGFLEGGTTGPWRFWLCIVCEDYLLDIRPHNKDVDEGPK